MNKIISYIRNPFLLYWKLNKYISFDWMSDKTFIKIKYHASMGKKLRLSNPQTYNEKLQWLKLYDHNPLYTTLVDKYAVKKHVSELVGEDYVIPTLGVWEHFDDIDFDNLPNQFVLKCTHDSGGIVIVRDKSQMDLDMARKKLEASLSTDYYMRGREWPYKNVPHRIIAEKYMVDAVTNELRDYKFFCFDGKPLYLFIASDRNKGNDQVKFDYFDINFRKLQLRQAVHPNSDYAIEKPSSFDDMIRIASILSKGLPQVRIDLYEIDGKVFFGEYTFFHHGGMVPFIPEKYDYIWGKHIILPSKSGDSL